MNNYKDLKLWQKSVDLAVGTYKVTNSFPKEEMYGLTSQIKRSAVSIPSNIAEGYERDSHKEQARFYRIAKGSCGEARTQIYIGIEAEYIDRDTGLTWVEEYRQLAAMLAAMIKKKELGARS